MSVRLGHGPAGVWHRLTYDSHDIFWSNKCLQILQILHQLASACISLHYCSHSVHSSSEGRAVYSIPRWLWKVAPAPHLQNTSSQWRQANSSEQAEPKPSVCERLDLCWIYVGKTCHWPKSWSFSHPFPWLNDSWLSHDSMTTQLSDYESLRCRDFLRDPFDSNCDPFDLLIAIAVLPCALQILGWEISLLGDERGEGGAVVAEEALEATLEECTEMYWKNWLRCTEYKFHQVSTIWTCARCVHAYHVLYICEMTWTWLNLYTYFDCFCPVWMNIDVYRFI